MGGKYFYFVEGDCEKKLLDALKQSPSLIKSGKVKVHNVIQNIIPDSLLFTIKPGTTVGLVFDTDKPETKQLIKNIERIQLCDSTVEVITLPQVYNFEDEIVRSTDVKKVTDLTKSRSKSEFKTDFCDLTDNQCRITLEHHHFDIRKMWVTSVPESFAFLERHKELKGKVIL